MAETKTEEKGRRRGQLPPSHVVKRWGVESASAARRKNGTREENKYTVNKGHGHGQRHLLETGIHNTKGRLIRQGQKDFKTRTNPRDVGLMAATGIKADPREIWGISETKKNLARILLVG